MPEELEKKVEKEADKLEGEGKLRDRQAFIYGTLRKTGWKPPHERETKSE